MRILLLTPPMTQLNTPYPATAYLNGFLRTQGIAADQADPALELVLKLLSRDGLSRIRAEIETRFVGEAPSHAEIPASIAHFLAHADRYLEVVEPAIRFLQGKDPSLALRIVSRDFLPEGPRFAALEQSQAVAIAASGGDPDSPLAQDPIGWAFGSLGAQDRAKYLASLLVDDLADVIREGVDARFGFSRYGEKLAASQPTFDPLAAALDGEPTLVDRMLDEITDRLYDRFQPELVALTAPFPGNVYGAFRMARRLKARDARVRTLLGGGYVNTELRSLREPRVFDFFDYVTLDDGEQPLLSILSHLEAAARGEGPADPARASLLRTFVRDGTGMVRLVSDPALHDIPFARTGTPDYSGLPLDGYLSILEMLNPMHRIWSDGRWNKLTLAHGCYWKKCNFCDVSLDYIGRYDPASADLIVDRIIALKEQTGQSGFHFVDEAAPPAALKAMAERLIARGVVITWWGNIRFEKTFTPELTKLLARSGCVAVSGGLEVASDRLLKLMNKGVTVEQVARVTRAFAETGVLVHAYLMYGFPTQTEAETIDALERVRQLFSEGCLHSAFWHRFSTTAHSPIGRAPESFGIRVLPEPKVTFARNDLAFEDLTACDHDRLAFGLRKALYNYMHGLGLDQDVRSWFDHRAPRPEVVPDLISRALNGGPVASPARPGLKTRPSAKRRSRKGRRA